MAYKLVTYDAGRGARAGIVVNDVVYDVAEGTGNTKDASVRALLTDWDKAKGRLKALADKPKGDGHRLASVKLLPPITDPIGITSSFGYDGSGLVTSMTTPYGTTNYAFGNLTSAPDRWVEITDPLGSTERVEFKQSASGIPSTESPVPTGITGL